VLDGDYTAIEVVRKILDWMAVTATLCWPCLEHPPAFWIGRRNLELVEGFLRGQLDLAGVTHEATDWLALVVEC